MRNLLHRSRLLGCASAAEGSSREHVSSERSADGSATFSGKLSGEFMAPEQPISRIPVERIGLEPTTSCLQSVPL